MSSSPDIIKDASDALEPISDRGITVMQGWYDKDIHDRHVIPLSDIGSNASNASLMMSGLLLMLSPHFNVLSK